MTKHFVLSDRWQTLQDDELHYMLGELAGGAENEYNQSNSNVEFLGNLGFYPEAQLLRLRHNQEGETEVVPYWLEFADYNLQRLDGTEAILNTVNAMSPIQLDHKNCVDYLHFRSFFLRQNNIMESLVLDDTTLPLLGLSEDQAKQCFGTYFSPLVTNKYHHKFLEARVLQFINGTLFDSAIAIEIKTGHVFPITLKEIPNIKFTIQEGLLSSLLVEPQQTTVKYESADLALPPITTVNQEQISAEPQKDLHYPNLTVLRSITPADNEADEALINAYSKLLNPIPLKTVPDDLKAISDHLNQRFPWFESVTSKIINALVVSAHGNRVIKLPPMLLVGSPGSGKTTYVTEMAQCLALPSQVINVAGKSDPRDLLGTARGYATRQPSLILRMMMQHEIANGLFLFDELDKAGTGKENGAVLDALLTFLENNSAKSVWDECLGASADLSCWNWIATANNTQTIPAALLSRFTVIQVANPRQEHYPAIVANTIKDFAQNRQIDHRLMPTLDEADWRWLQQTYKNPRKCRQATEQLLSHWLSHPKPGLQLH